MSPRTCQRVWQCGAREDGRLSGADLASFERHLETCVDCQGEVAALRRLRDLGQRLPDGARTPLSERRLRYALLRRADDLATGTRAAGRKPVLGGGVLVAAVAALCLWWLSPWVTTPAPSFEVVAAPGARWHTVDSGRALRLRIEAGRVAFAVDPLLPDQRFVLELPDGELRVKGTRFVVVAGDGRTRSVRVLEGRVVVRLRDGRTRVLNAGDGWEPATPSVHAGQRAADGNPPTTGAEPSHDAPPAARVEPSSDAPPVTTPAHRKPAPEPRTDGAPTSVPDARAARRDRTRVHRGERRPAVRVKAARNGDASETAPRAGETDVAPATEPEPTFERAMAAFSAGDYGRADGLFLAFIAAQPDDSRVEDARFLRAVGLSRQGRHDAAARAARAYLAAHPDGLRRADAERLLQAPQR